ncbi:alpha/beta hydrolase [uncultured Eubacterium sp.]|nr:hydrolase alpha/beta domain protein [Eubacterium sp. CAG:156]
MRPATIMLPPGDMEAIGIIEFVHGMCEHRNRYNHVLKYFSDKGFICAIADIKGHGENVLTPDDYGYFGEDGYKGLIQDIDDYTTFLKREYPNLPLILIGHSMGSLLVRGYIKKHSEKIDALVVCGSPSENSFTELGKILIRVMEVFVGNRYRSPFISRMLNGPFEKPFKKDGIKNAWLCSDLYEVDKYNKDERCGFDFTLNGYYSLFSLMQYVYNKDGYKNKNRDLEIMFISGDDDPCKINDKKFKESVLLLKKRGFQNTFSNTYPGMRHELFNEPDREEVFKDILKFIEIKLGIETSRE